MQNKANLRNDIMSVNIFITKVYEENGHSGHQKTKPKQSQNKPNKAKNKPNLSQNKANLSQNKANSNPNKPNLVRRRRIPNEHRPTYNSIKGAKISSYKHGSRAVFWFYRNNPDDIPLPARIYQPG